MASPVKLLYLIGQFPAVNHGYLLAEIRHLRRLGIVVHVASVNSPDRPIEQLSAMERDEAAKAYYIKEVPLAQILGAHLSEFVRHPVRYSRGIVCALRLSGPSPSRVTHHLAYFAEAVLVGREMRRLDLSHLHASFSATVALITKHAFPVTMSFGVYGFGELHDPVGTRLSSRIAGASFVRSISRHGRGQLMLSCGQNEWSKLHSVHLGIDTAEFPSHPQRTDRSHLRLLCVGRLSPEKGQVFLLDAMAALRRNGIPLRLHLVGDGPERASLERQSRNLGLAEDVKFEGWVDGPRLMTLYAETDIFALPSLAEGIPMVVMEAMAMQIPCVAPHITGLPELIEDGVDGMLFQVADVDDLVRAIQKLSNSSQLRLEMGQRARARVEREFDMARNTEHFAALLRQQLGVGAAQ